jgi:hypothetical protein
LKIGQRKVLDFTPSSAGVVIVCNTFRLGLAASERGTLL